MNHLGGMVKIANKRIIDLIIIPKASGKKNRNRRFPNKLSQ